MAWIRNPQTQYNDQGRPIGSTGLGVTQPGGYGGGGAGGYSYPGGAGGSAITSRLRTGVNTFGNALPNTLNKYRATSNQRIPNLRNVQNPAGLQDYGRLTVGSAAPFMNELLSGQRQQMNDYVNRAAGAGIKRGGMNAVGGPAYDASLQADATRALGEGYQNRFTGAWGMAKDKFGADRQSALDRFGAGMQLGEFDFNKARAEQQAGADQARFSYGQDTDFYDRAAGRYNTDLSALLSQLGRGGVGSGGAGVSRAVGTGGGAMDWMDRERAQWTPEYKRANAERVNAKAAQEQKQAEFDAYMRRRTGPASLDPSRGIGLNIEDWYQASQMGYGNELGKGSFGSLGSGGRSAPGSQALSGVGSRDVIAEMLNGLGLGSQMGSVRQWR